jgi:hypothetical protein
MPRVSLALRSLGHTIRISTDAIQRTAGVQKILIALAGASQTFTVMGRSQGVVADQLCSTRLILNEADALQRKGV